MSRRTLFRLGLAVIVSGTLILVAVTFGTRNGRKCVSNPQRCIAKLQVFFESGAVRNTLFNRYVVDRFMPGLGREYWVVEDLTARNALPFYKTIPAAPLEELTRTSTRSKDQAFRNWHRSHGDAGSTRYSLLNQINRSNVSELEVTWIYRSGEPAPGFGPNSVQSNPVIADGVMYFPTPGMDFVAVDAATGSELWRRAFRYEFHPLSKRGLIWWPGTGELRPRIYFPAGDKLVALDAETGTPAAAFGTNGFVASEFSSTAPAIFEDTILSATLKPSVEAYDVATGELRWKRDLNEEDMSQRQGGRFFNLAGGHPWGGTALDVERGIFYVTTGNPRPDHKGALRPGRNLHSCAVIAFDVATGERLWTFQDVRHDLWNLDIASPPILTSILRGGVKVDIVAVPTKSGNTLLLDRVSGKPIFDFRLKRAPTSTLPGERTWPYQPALERPEPFTRQVFGLDVVTNIGHENRASVMKQIDPANFGFFVPPEEGVKSVIFGRNGGALWPGGAVDAETGILYVSANDMPSTLSLVNTRVYDENTLPFTSGRKVYLEKCADCHGKNREGIAGPMLIGVQSRFTAAQLVDIATGGNQLMQPVRLAADELDPLIDYLLNRDEQIRSALNPEIPTVQAQLSFKRGPLLDFEGYPGSAPPWGTLNAIDLNTGKILWQVPLGEYEELTRRGIPVTGAENRGGPIVTKGGLVFVAGTEDRKIRAFDKETGEELWSYRLPFAGLAPPSTYEVDGRQYVVIPAVGGGPTRFERGDAFVAFALPDSDENGSGVRPHNR